MDISNEIAASFQNELENLPAAFGVQRHVEISDKVTEIYKKVGIILCRYRSGKLPKAFKVIPSLKNWTDVLALTSPENWTPNATYQAVRLFISLLPPTQAELFVKEVLLPKITKDLEESKELNVHYYNSMKKAIYRPGAFYKGLIIPLYREKSLTLKKASVIASILTKCTIPVLPSSAAIMIMCKSKFTSPRAIILKTLVEKNYSLPVKVLDEIVTYISHVEQDSCGVLYFQTLLSLVTKYYSAMSEDSRVKIRTLAFEKIHSEITPLIQSRITNSME